MYGDDEGWGSGAKRMRLRLEACIRKSSLPWLPLGNVSKRVGWNSGNQMNRCGDIRNGVSCLLWASGLWRASGKRVTRSSISRSLSCHRPNHGIVRTWDYVQSTLITLFFFWSPRHWHDMRCRGCMCGCGCRCTFECKLDVNQGIHVIDHLVLTRMYGAFPEHCSCNLQQMKMEIRID